MSGSPAPEPHLLLRLVTGRAFLIARMLLFAATLAFLALNRNVWATAFLLASLFVGTWWPFRERHEDIENPAALFWLKLGDKLLVNLLFLALFLRLFWTDGRDAPVVLCTGLVILTLRNVFYLIFSISLLKERRSLPLHPFWGNATNIALIVALVLYSLDTLRLPWLGEAVHLARISMVIGILLMLSTAVGYLYFYYRDEASRKPVSLATQVTFSRILLAPVFVWVFFYDNDLDYHNNHLIFKVMAALLAIFFVASDGLDGYLARKRGEVSQLGKYLDPYSDKITNMIIFLCFLASGYARVWMVAVIFFRESTVETLRTLAAASGVTIDARRSGKWKTALQGTAVIAILVLEIADTLILRYGHGAPWTRVWATVWDYTPYTLMTAVALITLLSGVDYFTGNRKVLERYF
ncbi:MAG TPA: CDP-diacylglycerol--glycerol-3-phosphate 3-phosphatidyltransferase [Fibrobacteria bacterium]|nr:CDP-diacylglycerol--glycerol-3-phosphate 3-phosphatidyltransferase [Fibrobacteria bacterium]